MHPSISAALETPCSKGKEAQTWLCSSGLSHPLHHHSSSTLYKTPTPTQLRESNNSGYFPSKLKKLISSLSPQQIRKSVHGEHQDPRLPTYWKLNTGTSGWSHRKFVMDTGWHWATPRPTKGTLYAAHPPPKPTGRGTWLFVLACFLIFRSVWENYVCDPSTERIP